MATDIELKLTPQQSRVVWCLQNGWVLITDNTVAGATVTNDDGHFYIGNQLFWNLYNKGITCQEHKHHSYVLSTSGVRIKVKEPKDKNTTIYQRNSKGKIRFTKLKSD